MIHDPPFDPFGETTSQSSPGPVFVAFLIAAALFAAAVMMQHMENESQKEVPDLDIPCPNCRFEKQGEYWVRTCWDHQPGKIQIGAVEELSESWEESK